MKRVEFVVFGQPARKGNNRIIAQKGGRPFLPKSKAAQEYQRAFVMQTGKYRDLHLGSQRQLLVVYMAVFYRHRFRGDLSEELILDCMQRAGIISDDRYVVEKHVWKRWDREHPRAHIRVEEMDAEEYGWKTLPSKMSSQHTTEP